MMRAELWARNVANLPAELRPRWPASLQTLRHMSVGAIALHIKRHTAWDAVDLPAYLIRAIAALERRDQERKPRPTIDRGQSGGPVIIDELLKFEEDSAIPAGQIHIRDTETGATLAVLSTEEIEDADLVPNRELPPELLTEPPLDPPHEVRSCGCQVNAPTSAADDHLLPRARPRPRRTRPTDMSAGCHPPTSSATSAAASGYGPRALSLLLLVRLAGRLHRIHEVTNQTSTAQHLLSNVKLHTLRCTTRRRPLLVRSRRRRPGCMPTTQHLTVYRLSAGLGATVDRGRARASTGSGPGQSHSHHSHSTSHHQHIPPASSHTSSSTPTLHHHSQARHTAHQLHPAQLDPRPTTSGATT